jgi:hypothetical protein
MNFKELREKYRSKYPASLVSAAVKIAIDMAGNMTGAYKKIENMKRGLGDDPIVKDALRMANESFNEAMSPADKKKRLEMIKKAVEKLNAKNDAKAKADFLKQMKDMVDEDTQLTEKGWKPESPAAFDKTMSDKKLQKDIAKFFDTNRHEFMSVKDAEKKFPYMIKYMKNSEFLKINKEKLTDKNLLMVATTMSED